MPRARVQLTPEQRAEMQKELEAAKKATENAKVADQRVQTQQERVQTQQERVQQSQQRLQEFNKREVQGNKNLELIGNRMQQLHTKVDEDFRQRLQASRTVVATDNTIGK